MNKISTITRQLLPYSMLKGVGPATLRKIATFAGFENETENDVASRLKSVEKALVDSASWVSALEAAEEQVMMAEQVGWTIVCFRDPEYPDLLRVARDDPCILYVRGTLAKEAEKSVAIVGTREPTEHGEIISARITRFFVENGWSVVSGLALGCDTVAHRTALEEKGHTVAVLAHGLQTIAPATNRGLAEEILGKGGALVSEYPYGLGAYPQQFVKRDRTQAGFAQGVVMIQSDLSGGSLHASRAILEYGRWLAVPYPTERDRNRGEAKIQANLLLADGSAQERAKLMRCKEAKLERIILLRTKEDYPALVDFCGRGQSAGVPKVQSQLPL